MLSERDFRSAFSLEVEEVGNRKLSETWLGRVHLMFKSYDEMVSTAQCASSNQFGLNI